MITSNQTRALRSHRMSWGQLGTTLGGAFSGTPVPANSAAWQAITAEIFAKYGGMSDVSSTARTMGYRDVRGAGGYVYRQFIPSGNIEILSSAGGSEPTAADVDVAEAQTAEAKPWQAALQTGLQALTSTLPTILAARQAQAQPAPSYQPSTAIQPYQPPQPSKTPLYVGIGLGVVTLVTLALLLRG